MEPPNAPSTMTEQDREIADTVARERPRLRNFIRRRVIDQDEAEDILQDVFEELVEAWRLPDPVEQVGAWLFRVARNRIIDRFRKKKEVPLPDAANTVDGEEADEADNPYRLDLTLPSADAGPEAAYARAALLDTLRAALDELPANQREVFIAHELDGRSFKEMAAATGVGVNTLLARKRYAVLHLRERLRSSYDGFEI
ncbi:Sigma24-like DNA-directed RNA polymerase specialized sigma subunit protein [Paraburkholderia caribensis MBA4]|uniref:Sigma24-like DNA-directed RNA polymerase specialized sigma subunit protein n=1 Tax=Paraburkholderia caribensis MBA4 TaxID=1323664 RepID=A0A0P0REE1_9BURK|nr:sigma-70 family RNA polymerase sigma factor [Paraburkholderia caribensis]ALL66767.1 Sigma24-like DNA-directed RNA polymerase specialized sigma subunit protein [Paraburkholderia caribensis MBA4]